MATRTPSALSVYLIAAGFRPPLPHPSSFARNTNEKLWLHVADADASATVAPLLTSLEDARGDAPDLVVSGHVLPFVSPGAVQSSLPRDRAGDVRKALEVDPPAVAIFLGRQVCPAFLYGLREAGCRTILVAAPTGSTTRGAGRILSRDAFRLFDKIAATNDRARSSLVKAGAPANGIEVIGRLDDLAPAPTVNETQLETFARLLGGRPIWLAANLDLSEMRAVLDAQRQANGLSHRMMLVIAPGDPMEADAFVEAAELRGYSVARRSLGQEPEDHIQIYLADTPDELGLWYRLAPITFVGGSLTASARSAKPDDPAALGSAILFGPEITPHEDAYERLASLGGARRVSIGSDLGAAVTGLLAPDKPAAMAHAAWLEISKGAEGTERVAAFISRALDDPTGF